jgi:hypothetical protein
MRAVSRVAATLALLALVIVPCYGSDNFPAQPLSSPSPSAPPQAQAQMPPQHMSPEARDRMYYGYVPPAPIRHTWPGGYKVLFHEIFNTLAEHILGNY